MSVTKRDLEIAVVNFSKKVCVTCKLEEDKKRLLEAELQKLFAAYSKIIMEYDVVVHGITDTDSKSLNSIREKISQIKESIPYLPEIKDEEINTEEIINNISSYVYDELVNKTDGLVHDKLVPFSSQVAIECLCNAIGESGAAVTMSTQISKDIILYSIIVGFLLSNYCKEHALRIVTEERSITDEEIERLQEISVQGLDNPDIS